MRKKCTWIILQRSDWIKNLILKPAFDIFHWKANSDSLISFLEKMQITSCLKMKNGSQWKGLCYLKYGNEIIKMVSTIWPAILEFVQMWVKTWNSITFWDLRGSGWLILKCNQALKLIYGPCCSVVWENDQCKILIFHCLGQNLICTLSDQIRPAKH